MNFALVTNNLWEREDRRKQSRDQLLATHIGIDSSLWHLKLIDCGLRDDDLKAFSKLSGMSQDRNVFFDPAFFSASHERLGNSLKKLVILSETLGEERNLKLAFPVQEEEVGLPRHRVLRVWSNPYAPLSTPLCDFDDLEPIVAVFSQILSDVTGKKVPNAIVFEDIPVSSSFVRQLTETHPASSAFVLKNLHERAILLPRPVDSFPASILSSKRNKEVNRLNRKLKSIGNFEYEVVDDLMSCLLRFEEFLLLETRSWKGKRRTSLHTIKRTAAFARQAIANLIEEDACRIHSLRINGYAVASVIVFRSGNWYFPWKMACDEAFLKYSVGKLLLIEMSKTLLETPDFEGADSLAGPDNFMINQIWPDRRAIGELVIGLGPDGASRALKISEALCLERRLKKIGKYLLGR